MSVLVGGFQISIFISLFVLTSFYLFSPLRSIEDTMTVSIVYDNSEAMELCAAQHLYLKPIAKLTINVMLPEDLTYTRSFSNWEILDHLKNLICPNQFSTVRLSKSAKDFIRFEGEAETRSLVQILKAKLHGKIIRLNGLTNGLKVVVTDAWPDFSSRQAWDLASKKNKAESDELLKQKLNDSLDSIYFQGLPCKWFASKGSSGEKPCEEVLRVVFESFGKIKNIDIPMLDPYRAAIGTSKYCTLGSLQTFEAFIQYQEYADFIKAMESLRGMKLLLKGEDGKGLACNIKVMFDTTQHFSEGAIRKRDQERLELQELEQERKREKRREEAERKRKDEKKLREKKRRSRLKRKEQRHKLKEEKHPRKKAKTQHFNSKESGKVNSQKMENIKTEEEHIVESEVKTFKKDDINVPPSSLFQETKRKIIKKKSTESESTLNHQPARRSELFERPSHLKKIFLRDLNKERSSDQLSGVDKLRFISPLNSLLITIKQDKSQVMQFVKTEEDDEEDWRVWNTSSNPKVYKDKRNRKDKIYETEEFIYYLLNYYQPSQYARFYEDPKNTLSKFRWLREVRDIGAQQNVNLNQSDSSIVQNGQKSNWAPEDDQQWNLAHQESRPGPREATDASCAEGFTEEFKRPCTESNSETEDFAFDVDRKPYRWQNSHVSTVKDSKHRPKRKSSQIGLSSSNYEVADFLEEISSNSDCFNETLSEDSEPRSSFPNKDNLRKVKKRSGKYDKIIAFDRGKRCSQCGMCPNPRRSKLKKTVKRSVNELKCSGPKDEFATNGIEENTRKKKKQALVEDGFHEALLDPFTIWNLRHPNKKLVQPKMKYTADFIPIPPPETITIPLLQGFSEDTDSPWEQKSDQDVGASNRCVKQKEGTSNSSGCPTSSDSPDPFSSENDSEKKSSVFKLKNF
ncbi:A-kinase anchor protein 17B-like isoform X2 [Sminthopsis crassicaudata]|uniref:A-kinase anchor protein 17B-like isoform X2 n=1 Tax=Sminthopsis crassicaudata TaxID=9301 RepID=UPI003D693F46